MLSSIGTETLQARYAESPYRFGAHFQSHPARLAAIGRLLGHPAADLRHARVLELGSASGLNLIPLAAAFPDAEFTGVELDATAVAEGRELIAAAGLANVRLEQADLRTFAPEAESYDYVIAHGVFSWVQDEVKAALLACCRRALRPQGIAYVSYNTYPGWKTRESLRDLLRLRVRGIDGVAPRREAAQATLAFLRQALTRTASAQAAALRDTIAYMEEKNPTVFYHDELGEINDPCYLLQFVEWAGEHGLHYLGDAHFASMLPDNLSGETGAALANLAPDQLQAEQIMDYVRQRTFRSTLLCRGPVAPKLELHPDTLRDCAFGSLLRAPVAVPDLREGLSVRFVSGSGLSLQTDRAAIKALLSILAAEWPRRVACSEAIAGVRRLLGAASVAAPSCLESQLVRCLLDLCASGSVDFLLACGLDCAARLPVAPRADALARVAAERGLPITNRWHENFSFDGATRRLLSSLDDSPRLPGQDDRKALQALLEAGLLRPEN